jgi:hypothetical protein
LSDILKLNGYSDVFKRPIFVLGLPFGGGTRTAQLIKDMGVWTGRTHEGRKGASSDFLENKLIRERLIKQTLKHMDCDPDGLETLPNPKTRIKLVFPTKEGNIDLKEKLHRMVGSQEYDSSQRWMYNDARLTLLWRSFLADFPNADWVIVRQERRAYVRSCLENPHTLEISESRLFWSHIHKVYSRRFDLLAARVKHVHEINLKNISEGNLSELHDLTVKIGIQFSPKRKGQKVEQKRWRHS